jgi:hypothetical protein
MKWGKVVDRFITPARKWSEPSRWHIYALPDLTANTALGDLVDRVRTVTSDCQVLSQVRNEWLHATINLVAGRSGRDVTPGQRDALIASLAESVADLRPFSATVGSPMANQVSVLLDVDQDLPDQPWAILSDRVRASIGQVFGPTALTYEPPPPHLTLAYGTGQADSGLLQSQLRRQVRPGHASWTIDRIYILDVTQDAGSSEYRWGEPVAEILLGA